MVGCVGYFVGEGRIVVGGGADKLFRPERSGSSFSDAFRKVRDTKNPESIRS